MTWLDAESWGRPTEMRRNAFSFRSGNLWFQLQFFCFAGALFMDGFGNILFGIALPTNVSTIFIFFALGLQLASGKLRIPIFLLIIYCYIAIQTFIFNFSENLFSASLVHFIGLIIFSITAFSFVSAYRDRLLHMIKMYYKFCFLIACIGIIQSAIFAIFGESISLQQMLGGPSTSEMSPEIFGVLPRSIGTASEPATYATMLIPGMFVSLLVLSGRGVKLNLNSRIIAGIILTGFILSFSLVGFIGLALSIVTLSITGSRKSRLIAVLIASVLIIGGFFAASSLTMWGKLSSLISMSSNPTEYDYTTNDLSGFALISNMLVAREGLLRSNYFGTGLNTHENTYDDVISSLFYKSQIIYELNKRDAGSLIIRLVSEFGVPGLLALGFFLLHYKLIHPHDYSTLRVINDICFVVLIMYSARNGSYLSVVFWLFSAIYVYSYKMARDLINFNKNKARLLGDNQPIKGHYS